ncbi:MAG: magnesium transporter [Pseudomonadota bacterium]
MTADPVRAADALNRRFFVDHPLDAAQMIERLNIPDVVDAAKRQPAQILTPVWRRLLPETAANLLRALPEDMADQLLADVPSAQAVRLLAHMPESEVEARLARLDPAIRKDLETLLAFPADTAGRLMNAKVSSFRRDATAGETIARLRTTGMNTARSLFLVDDEQRLSGKASLTDVALAPPETLLSALESPVVAAVRPVDSLEEITQIFGDGNILDLPVIDLDGVMLGAITHDDIARTVQKDATADLQTMVGASKEERALSSPFFTVRKRMPWLQINLVTAFMAAAVVGVFESTIAQVTALAVLLPVVAGQSGNTGAQALAVTMRGLALREITVRQWAKVTRKEVLAGFINGLGVAATCGMGVYIWSQSAGLVAVIMSSMVLAMVAAGLAGAIIPVALTRLGQDPATSSSIILTTVTDITGFFAFLGIATMLMKFL